VAASCPGVQVTDPVRNLAALSVDSISGRALPSFRGWDGTNQVQQRTKERASYSPRFAKLSDHAFPTGPASYVC
jgi:hypothetical protein